MVKEMVSRYNSAVRLHNESACKWEDALEKMDSKEMYKNEHDMIHFAAVLMTVRHVLCDLFDVYFDIEKDKDDALKYKFFDYK